MFWCSFGIWCFGFGACLSVVHSRQVLAHGIEEARLGTLEPVERAPGAGLGRRKQSDCVKHFYRCAHAFQVPQALDGDVLLWPGYGSLRHCYLLGRALQIEIGGLHIQPHGIG